MDKKMRETFRASAKWRKFRQSLFNENKYDPLTKKTLRKGFICHHRDLNKEHYTDLSDPYHFVLYNKKTHETVHYLYDIGMRREDGIEGLIFDLYNELFTMRQINKKENKK